MENVLCLLFLYIKIFNSKFNVENTNVKSINVKMFTPIFSKVVNRVHDDVCSELNFALLKAPLQYSVNEQNLTPDTKYVMKIALLLAIYVLNFIFHGNVYVYTIQ